MKNANISRYFFSFQNIKYLIKGFQSLQVQTEQIEFVCDLTHKRFGGEGVSLIPPLCGFSKKVFPININYFHGFNGFFDISLLQRN